MSSRPIHLVAVPALIAAVAGLVVAWGAHRTVSAFRSAAMERTQARMLDSAVAFAHAAQEWIAADSSGTLQRAVDLMLHGSSRIVEISHRGERLADGRVEGWESTALEPMPSSVMASRSRFLRLNGRLVCETTIPLHERGASIGAVRIVARSQMLESRIAQSLGLIVAAAAAIWSLLVVVSAWGWRRTYRYHQAAPATDPGSDSSASVERNPLVVDLRSKTVSRNGATLSLTPKPFTLLAILAADTSRVYSDAEIMDVVWRGDRYVSSNDVHQCIYRLRRCLNDLEPGLGNAVANVRGFGYRLAEEVQVHNA